MASNGPSTEKTFPKSDPSIYAEYESKWAELPTDVAGWLQRAKDVSSVLAKDAGLREREKKSPLAEITLFKHSGLLKILGPKKYGGGEQPWSVAFKAVREVSKGDGSLGMLLGYHLLWSTTANVVGTPEQADRFQKLIIENNYFVGAAVNPRDNDLRISTDGDNLVYSGFKFFSTGGVISDLTVLEGVLEGTEDHIFAIVKTDQPGIVFSHDWDNIGVRLTESGSVRINQVTAPWADALGWDLEKKRPDPAILGIPFTSLLLPTFQLIFSNFYLGVAVGALEFATAYTTKSTRSWPFGGEKKEKGVDEFYILTTYGNFFAHLRAAEALVDKVGLEIDAVYENKIDPADRAKITAEIRGEVAEWVTSAKIVTTDTGLRVTSGIFEVTGSKSTAAKVDMDRFWRDIRVHSLHDPVAYKNRELGRYLLVGEFPVPSWYT